MRLLMIGCGAVGEVIAQFVAKRGQDKWLETLVLADYSMENVNNTLALLKEQHLPVVGVQLDASNKDAIVALCKEHSIDTVMDASPPFLAETIFDASYEADCHFLNMGTWSLPKYQVQKKEAAFEVYDPFMAKYHLDRNEEWTKKSLTGIICVGIDPGVVNVFANYCSRYLFDTVEEIHVKDGSNLAPKEESDDITFGFNVWTVLDECLNPSITWSEDEGYMAHPPFSGEELFEFPEDIGYQKIYQIEHEEVYLFTEHLRAQGLKKCTYKIALDDDLVNALTVIEKLGLRSLDDVTIGNETLKKRDILARLLPQPTAMNDDFTGKMCVGVQVIGVKDGLKREVFMYQTYDQQEAIDQYQSQAVVAQTGVGAGIAIELMGLGIWKQAGVYGPEGFDPKPYINVMKDVGYAYDFVERPSEYAKAFNKSNMV